MIKPTVGRNLYFFEHAGQKEPLAAIIAKVHSDDKINVAVFDETGGTHGRADILLRQPEEASHPKPGTAWCEWMPFQAGQSQAVKDAQAAGGVK